MTNTVETKYQKTILNIPHDLHFDARMFALKVGISLAELMRRALAEYLQNHEQDAPHAA